MDTYEHEWGAQVRKAAVRFLFRVHWRAFVASLFLPLLASAATGPIVIDPEFPHSFRHQSGERFYPMGDTAYFLIAQPTNVIARYIAVRSTHRFNYIRVMAMAEGFWPFGGTPKHPDYTTINETMLRKWDWLFDTAAAQSMKLELILWGYGVAGGEGLWTNRAAEDLWISTLVNRFKDRPNLLMWTVANEFERYPDGKYIYTPGDVEWAKTVASRIRRLDSVHPIGCHPSVWITDQDEPGKGPRPFATYQGFTQSRPQVVWPLWKDSAVNINVTQNNQGVQPRTWGDFAPRGRGLSYFPIQWKGVNHPVRWTATGWDYEAAGLEDCLAEDAQHGKPVINSEFGYQHEPGYETDTHFSTRQCHRPATVRKKAWKCAASGAYFAVGFINTAVRDFTEGDVDNFHPHDLEVLHRFFTVLPYWRMRPFTGATGHAVALAEVGKTYVVYLPRGGPTTLDLSAASGAFTSRWFNPRTGESSAPFQVEGGAQRKFTAPDNEDWTLHLQATTRE